MLKLVTSSVALFALTACGGNGSGGKTSLESFVSEAQASAAQAEALSAFGGTKFTSMPTSDTAEFNGKAGIVIDPVANRDRDDILILGTSTMTADFRAGTMTGSITDMTAATNINDAAETADIYGVDGRINIGRNESIIGDDFDDNRTDLPNEWYADYRGEITVNGNTYDLDGALNGQFVGTRANPTGGQSPIKGIIGYDDAGFATINGGYEVNEAPISVEVFGRN